MSDTIFALLFILGAPFLVYGLYNVLIGFAGLRKHTTYAEHAPENRMCAVIAARNEGTVIGHLIDTLMQQNYPKELFDIYVIPNNCTDDTEAVALAHGAKIFTCTKEVKSKGAALEQFFDHIFAYEDVYDAFCVFDADNLVDPGFFTAMNNALCSGEKIAQGYRESKNPEASWISGCQSVFYWTQNRFMNLAKQSLGWSAALNGTGFMVSREVLENGGFRTFTMTEDIEFTTQSILRGYRVAWVPEAMTYDEHPINFNTSWKQRKRWSTGIIQCFSHYAAPLWKMYKETKTWMALDMIVYLSAPLAQVLTSIYSVCTFIVLILLYINTGVWSSSLTFAIGFTLFGVVSSFFFSAIVLKMEKHGLKDVAKPTIFSFWFFLFSWIFINVLCFIKPITVWEPIEHTQGINMKQLKVSNN